MAKVRKLSGEAGLTDKIFTSSKNINYVHLMVLSLSNHWPSNNNISFKDSYAKTTITKKLILPPFLLECSQDPLVQNRDDFR